MKKYNIIYADPPWEYKQSGSKTSYKEYFLSNVN